MPNKYSFIGDDDLLGGRIFIYENEMRAHDLNTAAITTFALAIRNGDCAALKGMFNILSDQQKKGLLNFHICYWDLPGTRHIDSSGYPIDLARRYEKHDVAQFLTQEKVKFFDSNFYLNGAVFGLFYTIKKAKTFTPSITDRINTFLEEKDKTSISLTKRINHYEPTNAIPNLFPSPTLPPRSVIHGISSFLTKKDRTSMSQINRKTHQSGLTSEDLALPILIKTNNESSSSSASLTPTL